MLVASSSKWLNITAIIQDVNFKLHSLVKVINTGEERELISTVFRVNTFITSVMKFEINILDNSSDIQPF
jgi:hypothetical protein